MNAETQAVLYQSSREREESNRAAKSFADAAKARAWKVLRRRQTAMFDTGAQPCIAK